MIPLTAKTKNAMLLSLTVRNLSRDIQILSRDIQILSQPPLILLGCSHPPFSLSIMGGMVTPPSRREKHIAHL